MSYERAGMNDWEDKLQSLSKSAHTRPVFVLFVAGPKDSKHPPVSWCSDCERAVPAVREAATGRGVYLLEVSVGDSAGYKAPTFLLRTRPDFQPFPGIPLLVAFKGEKLVATEDLQPCQSHEDALESTNKFLTQQLRLPSNPFKCPYIKYGTIAGVAIVLGVGVALYLQAKENKAKGDRK